MNKKFLNLIFLLLTCLATQHTTTMKRSFDQTGISQKSIHNLAELKQRPPLKKQKTNSELITFACTYCDKSFSQKGNLTIHTRTHTGERPYKCTICDKTFIKQYCLTIHERIHTGEKPYKCHICDRTFTQNSHLTYHIKTHSKKPYFCYFCKKNFSQSQSLEIHINTHLENYAGVTNIAPKQLELFQFDFIDPSLIPNPYFTQNI